MAKNDSVLSREERLRSFHQGTELRAWEWLGVHAQQNGTVFRVWAPHAKAISVICEANGWLRDASPMHKLPEDPTIWECVLPNVRQYDSYKYSIWTADGQVIDKADPFAFHADTRPANASKVYSIAGYEWHDGTWMRRRLSDSAPMNIYEVHFGSWQVREDSSFYSYREMADKLIPYVCDMGYTHLELLPLTEHPFDGSWGYQTLGWFAATSRYGTPQDLMYFIDRCHQAGLSVILDWNASGFPSDAHGLYRFDGEACYECPPPEDEMPFGMRRFDLGKKEVMSFLLSSAVFWISQFHVDGLRVSSVQPMLYLDYARQGHWTANRYGENLDLDGAEFLRQLCDSVHTLFPKVQLIASNAGNWHSVTKPTCLGGLGFARTWRDDWVRQALEHVSCLSDQEEFTDWLTLSLLDSTGEQDILPLSHDTVSHGDGSLLSRMPGDYTKKFAHLRAFYGFVMAHPGDKLLFMGGEFAQFTEWACHHGLDWNLLGYESHRQMREYVRALNLFYKSSPPLWDRNDTDSFVWVDAGDTRAGVLSFERRSRLGERLLAVINFTDARVGGYTMHMTDAGIWEEVFSSDLISFGGSGVGGGSYSTGEDRHHPLTLCAPANSVRFFRFVTDTEKTD